MKKHIPNLLTCGNLICGFFGIINSFEGKLTYASYLILLAMVFDFFDGFVARALKVSGPMGKELDSLADCVSFGALPGVILYCMIQPHHPQLAYLAAIVPVFSALRLAKFNIDPRQSDSFIGVPTPANAMLIGSLPLIAINPSVFTPLTSNPYVLAGIGVVMSFLLVAELPLLALKFKDYTFAHNKFTYILIALSVVLLAVFNVTAVPLIIVLYILLSVIKNFTQQTNEVHR